MGFNWGGLELSAGAIGPAKMGLNRVMGLRPNNKRKTKIIIKIKRIIKDDKQKY